MLHLQPRHMTTSRVLACLIVTSLKKPQRGHGMSSSAESIEKVIATSAMTLTGRQGSLRWIGRRRRAPAPRSFGTTFQDSTVKGRGLLLESVQPRLTRPCYGSAVVHQRRGDRDGDTCVFELRSGGPECCESVPRPGVERDQ